MFILSITGTLPDRRPVRLRELRHEAGNRPRSGRGDHRSPGERYARDRGDSRPREAERRRADRGRRGGCAQGAEHHPAGRTIPGIRTPAPGAGVGALEERRADRPGAGEGQERRDDPRRGCWQRHARRSGSDAAHHRQRARRRVDEDRPANRRQHPRSEGRRRRGAGQPRARSCPPASESAGSTISPSSSKSRSPASATPS